MHLFQRFIWYLLEWTDIFLENFVYLFIFCFWFKSNLGEKNNNIRRAFFLVRGSLLYKYVNSPYLDVDESIFYFTFGAVTRYQSNSCQFATAINA